MGETADRHVEKPPPREALRAQLERVKAEVDALQIASAEQKPWWRRHSSDLIALVAVLATIATAVYAGTLQRKQDDLTAQQDSLQAASELTNLLAQIGQAKETQRTLATLGDAAPQSETYIVRAQLISLCYKAASIVDSRPQLTTAAEYYVLGQVFLDTLGLTQTAKRYFREAMNKAVDFITYESAGQALGAAEFKLRRATAAREVLDTATHPNRHLDADPAKRLDLLSYTYILWASYERLDHQCSTAQQYLTTAHRLMTRLQRAFVQQPGFQAQYTTQKADWKSECGEPTSSGHG